MDGKRANNEQKQNNKRGAFRSKRRRTVHEHVSKGVIRRLARRGGVKRLSALIYDEMRMVLKTYLDRLIKDSIIYCEYSNRKTVQVEDVVRALKSRGERLYGFDDPPFPIKLRSTIVLTDTPEESIPSTLETTENNVRDSEVVKENTATTSRRFSENLNDSDSTLSDIALNVKRNISSRLISEGGEITHASANEDSDNSESLLSLEENIASSVKSNRNSLNISKASSKYSDAPVKPASSDVTTNESAANSDLESTEENNSTLPEKENRKTLNVSKSSSRYAEGKNKNPIPNTSNTGKVTREPLNERRRGLFRHTRSTATALRNSGEITGMTDKSTTSAANPRDSDDFQDNFDLLVKNRKNLERSKLSAKNELSLERNALNTSVSDVVVENDALNARTSKKMKRNSAVAAENFKVSGKTIEANSDDEDILFVWQGESKSRKAILTDGKRSPSF